MSNRKMSNIQLDNNRKKVLLVCGSLGSGGIEKTVSDYSVVLSGENIEITYLVFEGTEDVHYDKVVDCGSRIIKISRPNDRKRFYNEVRKVIREEGPFDIVHSHILFSSGIVMKAAYKEGVKERIAHSHDNLSNIKISFFANLFHYYMRLLLLKYSTSLVACSLDAGLYVFGDAFINRHGIVFKNRIDPNIYKYNAKNRALVRKKYGIKADEYLIGTIGRVEFQKNHRFIVDLLAYANERNIKMKAMIVGDGSKMTELKEYIRKKSINNVILLGRQKNPEQILSAFDCFILPSVHEGFGIVLLEAQANGLFCIAPERIVPSEAKVLDSFSFIKYSQKDSEEAWLRTILKKRPRVNCGDAKRQIVESGYSFEDFASDLKSLYNMGREKI